MSHEPYPRSIPLNAALYNSLGEGGIEFLKQQTGIQDESALRDHVLQVQAEAYAVYAYPCIRIFKFAMGNIAKHPDYQQALALAGSRRGAIFLDLGCCMGSDIRKAISDGFPKENIIASDVIADFWTLGHKLFKTNQNSFPVPFLVGDIRCRHFFADEISCTCYALATFHAFFADSGAALYLSHPCIDAVSSLRRGQAARLGEQIGYAVISSTRIIDNRYAHGGKGYGGNQEWRKTVVWARCLDFRTFFHKLEKYVGGRGWSFRFK